MMIFDKDFIQDLLSLRVRAKTFLFIVFEILVYFINLYISEFLNTLNNDKESIADNDLIKKIFCSKNDDHFALIFVLPINKFLLYCCLIILNVYQLN